MIAILFALNRELASLKPLVTVRKKVTYAHAIFYQSEFQGLPVTLVKTGIGKSASAAVQYLLNQYKIQLIVSSGFAGSINPSVNIGDIVVGKKVLHTSQSTLDGKIQVDSQYCTATSIVDLAMRLNYNNFFTLHCGDILSVDNIIYRSSTKHNIGRQTPAIAVDMESFTIAALASTAGIPFVTIRAISDGVDEDLRIKENMITHNGKVNLFATLLYILSKPHHILYLKHLSRNIRHATRTLSAFFPNFIQETYNLLLTC